MTQSNGCYYGLFIPKLYSIKTRKEKIEMCSTPLVKLLLFLITEVMDITYDK